MLHLVEFSADDALGMAGVWLVGPGALPLVAAAPWSVCEGVDLTMLGKRIATAGGNFQSSSPTAGGSTAATRSIFRT
jgi:hypothetical protein